MHEYTVRRDMRNQITAETIIPMGFDRRQLRISTMKGSRGLFSSAQVVQVSEDGRGFSFVMFRDFNKRVCTSGSRATENGIRALHETALIEADALLAEATAHYHVPAAA